jgi:hypothetical protein
VGSTPIWGTDILVAQLEEHDPPKVAVTGSSPVGNTADIYGMKNNEDAVVAQSEERGTPKPEVAGSSPADCTCYCCDDQIAGECRNCGDKLCEYHLREHHGEFGRACDTIDE